MTQVDLLVIFLLTPPTRICSTWSTFAGYCRGTLCCRFVPLVALLARTAIAVRAGYTGYTRICRQQRRNLQNGNSDQGGKFSLFYYYSEQFVFNVCLRYSRVSKYGDGMLNTAMVCFLNDRTCSTLDSHRRSLPSR